MRFRLHFNQVKRGDVPAQPGAWNSEIVLTKLLRNQQRAGAQLPAQGGE